MTKYSSSAAWCLLLHITPRQQRAAARTPPFIRNHQWAAVASTHWRQLERRCLEMRRYSGSVSAAGCKITPDCGDCGGSVFTQDSRTLRTSVQRRLLTAHTPALLVINNFTIVLLVFYVIYLLMKATYKCLQEVRPCTRANTGNKQRAQCWSASAAALLSTKHGI